MIHHTKGTWFLSWSSLDIYVSVSCCIDYVAAAHVGADAIIHFGPTCFSKTSGDVHYLNIYEKHCLQVQHLEDQISGIVDGVEDTDLVIVLDDAYIHYFGTIALFQ